MKSMKSYHQKRVKKRTIILFLFSILWLCLLVFRLIQLQVIDHPRLKKEAIQQNQNKSTIEPRRGTIFDRNGTILARSIPKYSVFYQPMEGESDSQNWATLTKLKKVLELTPKKLETIREQIKKDAPFIWIVRKIDETQADRVQDMDLNGIYLREENKRFYPQGSRAAHVLGRVDIDERGVSGVEYKYNTTLQGKEGEGLILRDAKRRRYRFETLKAPVDGKDLVLTLDEIIQYISERELQKAVAQYQAEWGTVIVSLPSSGEILALANYPTYDLNHLPNLPTRVDRNRAIHHTYDPGSTFKVVTVSAAVENNSVGFNETFDCSQGYVVWAGNVFRDHQKFGILSFPQVFIHSSNIGTIGVGQRIGEKNLFNAIKYFGFGQKTGIDLPAEERGLLNPLEKWTKISVASHSIGYEISVTPIQMLQAINVIANNGVSVSPKLVKKVLDTEVETPDPSIPYKRVISDETSAKVSAILLDAVLEGTGMEAQISGYTVIGKTGTAQKFDPVEKKYLSSAHTASFVGFVTQGRPLFSMIVVIDDPKGHYYGGQVAAPLFREIAKKILRYLRVPPDRYTPATLVASTTRRETKE
jgi:cell division protein FtsI/penicillin-binding protein 2